MTTLLTIAGTLLAVWITQYLTTRRWYADYLLKRKFEILSNLYANLVEYKYNISMFGKFHIPGQYQEFINEITLKGKDFLKARAMASIYLDDEGEKILSEWVHASTHAMGAIYLQISKNKSNEQDSLELELEKIFGNSIDWDKFSNTYEKATVYLKNKLNPDLLDQIFSWRSLFESGWLKKFWRCIGGGK